MIYVAMRGNLRKRKAYNNIYAARKAMANWCKAHKGEFINFYRSETSYTPIGSMIWYAGYDTPSWFKMWGCDDRYITRGVSEGPYRVYPNGKI